MIKRVQLVRHIKSAADLFLGLVGEVTVNTTDNAARVHDGATIGGHEMARKDVANVPAATGAVDGKMTSVQAGDLSTTKANLDAHIGGTTGHPVVTPSVDGFASAADKTKLNGIESAATADQTAGDIRSLGFFDITNDGSGSGLDADLLDGLEGSVYATDAEVAAADNALAAILRGELNAPSGTKALFVQTTAPTGWTKDVDQNDKALRIVSGTAGTGGSTGFTTIFGSGKRTGNTALTIAQMPVHNHSSEINFSGAGQMASGSTFTSASASTTGNSGSGATHDHSVGLNVAFVDIIKATKDA